MSKREVELFIFDIYVAILKIEYVAKDFSNIQDLLHDFKSWDTIIREFEIIGEATKYLINQELLNKNFQIVVDFRNLIIHEYFGIDPNEVDNIIKNDLGNFKRMVLSLINNINTDLKNELIGATIEDNKYLSFIVQALQKLINPLPQ
jgi:uncharacterized protein with HEPN domain